MNIRKFTQEGTFKAFKSHLGRLKYLGADIIWLMPIHPIGEKNRQGTLGSYYSVKDYYTVNPDFGTIDDFTTGEKKEIQQSEKIDLPAWGYLVLSN